MGKQRIKTHIQPIIVRLSDNELNPINLRLKYFINYNMLEIDWFENYYLVLQGAEGLLLMENDNQHNPLDDPFVSIVSEDYVEPTHEDHPIPFDIPRVYFLINDTITKDDEAASNLVATMLANDRVVWMGNDQLTPGVDYFINQTLDEYLKKRYTDYVAPENFVLPNYLTAVGHITGFWTKLDNGEEDFTDIDYYNKQNDNLDKTYTIDELKNFYSTFCKTILDFTPITDETLNSGNNPIYKLVLEYFANFQSDAASSALALILGSSLKNSSCGQSLDCGCNSIAAANSLNGELQIQKSCSELYDAAMKEWLIQMLGDPDFYADWMYQYLPDGTYIPDPLIDYLITLIEEFMDLGYDLSFITSRGYYCRCSDKGSSAASDANYKILENYLKVLNYVKDCEIDANINKIKIYGNDFGELLPKLQF